MTQETEKLPIIGRERMLVNKLAKQLNVRGSVGHEVTKVTETRRGATFLVRLFDGKEYTHRIARVTVDFEEVDRATGLTCACTPVSTCGEG